MAETRNRDQTSTRHAPLGDSGMPAGQAPATRPPLTAVERRNAENAEKSAGIKAQLMSAIEQNRMEIESFLGVFGIPYDVFMASLTVFLSKQQRDQPDFFVDLHIPSFLEALTRIAMNGLMADGKEAAIAAYKDSSLGQKVAQAMFMRDGFVKVLWRTGMVRSINDQVVTQAEYEGGRFDYEEGDQGFIQHRLDLMRKDSDTIVAAYCIIELMSGGVMREVVPKDELDKMARMSKSPARAAWAHQMHRKGAIRRIMGKMPREKAIVQLLQHDDEGYDLKLANAPSADAPTHQELFSNRPIRNRRAVPKEVSFVEHGADLDGVGHTATKIVDDGSPGADHDPRHDNSAESDAPAADREQGAAPAADGPFVLRALLTAKLGVQVFDPAHPDLWYGDIRQRMKVLSPDQLVVFWQKNYPFIEEAGRNGFGAEAMKLVELAEEMDLMGGDHGR